MRASCPVEIGDIHIRYAVISSPRSGSKMFCDTLRRTNLMGDPREWFNMRYLQTYRKVVGLDVLNFANYVSEILTHTSSQNGVFGVNFHIDQYMALKEKSIDIFDHISFDRVYYLERADKLSQAYSLAKARITDVWSTNVAFTQAHQKRVDTMPDAAVFQELVFLSRADAYYQECLKQRIDQHFVYEEIVQDKERTVFADVLADLGIPFPKETSFSTTYKRQSDAADQDKIERLRAYLGIIRS